MEQEPHSCDSSRLLQRRRRAAWPLQQNSTEPPEGLAAPGHVALWKVPLGGRLTVSIVCEAFCRGYETWENVWGMWIGPA